jgi:hypothetical protein
MTSATFVSARIETSLSPATQKEIPCLKRQLRTERDPVKIAAFKQHIRDLSGRKNSTSRTSGSYFRGACSRIRGTCSAATSNQVVSATTEPCDATRESVYPVNFLTIEQGVLYGIA